MIFSDDPVPRQSTGKRVANGRFRSAAFARQSVTSTTATLLQVKARAGTRPLDASAALPCRRPSRSAPKVNACPSGCVTKAPSVSGSTATWPGGTAARRQGCTSPRRGSGGQPSTAQADVRVTREKRDGDQSARLCSDQRRWKLEVMALQRAALALPRDTGDLAHLG